MNYELCDNFPTSVRPEESQYLDDVEFYQEATSVKVKKNSASLGMATLPAVLNDLTNPSLQPVQELWPATLPLVEQNHQQIQYLPQILQNNKNTNQELHGQFYFIEPQQEIGSEDSIVNLNLAKSSGNTSTPKPLNCETDDLRKWRKQTKSLENKKRRCIQRAEDMEVQRLTANERERQRTYNLNEAFSCLRRIIPTLSSDKMTKIDIVHLATRYIEFLCQMLTGNKTSDGASTSDQPRFTQDQLNYAFSVWRMDSMMGSLNDKTPSELMPMLLEEHARRIGNGVQNYQDRNIQPIQP